MAAIISIREIGIGRRESASRAAMVLAGLPTGRGRRIRRSRCTPAARDPIRGVRCRSSFVGVVSAGAARDPIRRAWTVSDGRPKRSHERSNPHHQCATHRSKCGRESTDTRSRKHCRKDCRLPRALTWPITRHNRRNSISSKDLRAAIHSRQSRPRSRKSHGPMADLAKFRNRPIFFVTVSRHTS